MPNFGLTFQPGVPRNGNGNGNGTQQRGRVQEPVQVLSTRLPKIFGAGAIAPASLLQGAGGMGMPGARGNVVAQALAQLAGLPPSMGPSPAPYESPQPSAPQSASGYGDWVRHERNLPGSGRPGLPSFGQQPAPWVTPIPTPFPTTTPVPPPPPMIPLPRVGAGKETGEGPTQPFPMPGPFQPPIFPTPPPTPTPQPRPDVESIQAIADALFRKFPQGVPSGLSPRLRGDYY